MGKNLFKNLEYSLCITLKFPFLTLTYDLVLDSYSQQDLIATNTYKCVYNCTDELFSMARPFPSLIAQLWWQTISLPQELCKGLSVAYGKMERILTSHMHCNQVSWSIFNNQSQFITQTN